MRQLRDHPPKIDLEQFCKRHHISVRRLAELLRTPVGTMRNWVKNRRAHPQCLPFALGWLEDRPHLLEKPRKLRTPKEGAPLAELPVELRWKTGGEE